MAYSSLDEITGIGKAIVVRDKRTGTIYRARIIDETSVSDGEQKYVAQLAELEPDTCCEGDPTRTVIRVGYASLTFYISFVASPSRSRKANQPSREKRRWPTVSANQTCANLSLGPLLCPSA